VLASGMEGLALSAGGWGASSCQSRSPPRSRRSSSRQD
jgi:hypothetical protein